MHYPRIDFEEKPCGCRTAKAYLYIYFIAEFHYNCHSKKWILHSQQYLNSAFTERLEDEYALWKFEQY